MSCRRRIVPANGLVMVAAAVAALLVGVPAALAATGSTGPAGATAPTGPTGATTPIPHHPLRRGERGPAVLLLQHELSSLHYVVGRLGTYDARTARAVLTFRKMTGMVRNEVADPTVFAKLAAGDGVFHVRYPHQPRHVEGDLTHQVLALVGANGQVQRLYPMSSGRPTLRTQTGIFRVYLQELGTNNDGMVDSNFFNGGDAIHGYAEVPVYPYSHGCLRVPIPDALSIHNWLHIGTIVDVYYRHAARKHG
jgi:peptidoglycan hydrolase-like protein with peptidoglycan-binding domain